ncbi:MAG: hypothetical protein IKK82_00160 [Kiritimatiellae bacterium]|nr:hypothetical protein [Kiritimatiellia bacterium]
MSKQVFVNSKIHVSASIMAVVLGTTSVDAALKYEPDSYVQDGLVLHLDGIRNVGALKPHDSSASKWVDLSGRGNWANFVKRTDTDTSAWQNGNGYLFAGMSYAITDKALPDTPNLTIEAYGHFPRSKQMTDGGFSSTFLSPVSQFDFRIYRASGAFMVQWLTDNYGCGGWDSTQGKNVRPSVSNWGEVDFACVMSDSTAAMYENCSAEGGGRGFSMDRKEGAASPKSARWVLANSGVISDSVPDYLNGTTGLEDRFKSEKTSSYSRQAYCTYNTLRIYNRALTQDELAKNNALDIIRYKTGIPVTNAIVRTSVIGAEGAEPAGVYAVDGKHVFSAPVSVKVGEKIYAANGYNLERWDAETETWLEAVECTKRFCEVSEDEKVRITWQWEETEGILGELSAAHYMQDGLVLHFDGIENAGLGKTRDVCADTWKDLSPSKNDLNFEELTSSLIATENLRHWNENGCYFNGNSYGVTKSAINIAPERKVTVQTVTAFVPAQQKRSYPAPFGTTDDYCNLYTYTTGASLQLKILNIGGQNGVLSSWAGRYATAMVDQGNKCVFQTVLPNSDLTSGTSTKEYGERYWYVGAAGLAGDTGISGRTMIGTVHAVRAYCRVLADDELMWNRIIDDYRFFGEVSGVLPTNSVVVATELEGYEGREPNGMYLPSGWTFKMDDSTQKTIGDKDYEFAGYVLETWDAEKKSWTNPVTNMQSTTWTSPVSGNWPSVRLTWGAKVVRGVIPVPDVDDYVRDGLILHLDGFRNAGAEKPQDAGATSWINLARGGSAAITHHADGDSSAWTRDGYFFGGKTVAIMDNALALSTTVTVQVACNNVDMSLQTSAYPTIMGLTITTDKLNIYWNSEMKLWYWKLGDYIAGEKYSWAGDYLTAIYKDGKKAFFETATPLTWGTWDRQVDIGAITPIFGGGRGNISESYTDWYLKGEIKNVRIYDRVLSDAELEKNREIDEVRRAYRPNVEVAGGSCGAAVEEPGLYHVQGEWTFSATNVVDRFGCHRTVVGYTLEAAQDGVWGEPIRYHGSTYTHKVDERVSDFVRLVWRLSPRGLRVIVR